MMRMRQLSILVVVGLVACSDVAPRAPLPNTPEDGVDRANTDDKTPPDTLVMPDHERPVGTKMDAAVARSMSDAGRAVVGPAPDAGSVADEPTADSGPVFRDAEVSPSLDAGPPVAVAPDTPLPTEGAPIQARDGVWTYVEFPETKCRDGSPAGVSVRLNKASNKLLFYLEGGVYCFDALTCAINPANVSETLFNSAKTAPTVGIFDQNNRDNPVREWNLVYVPYCTGDAMGGTKTAPTDVPGGPDKQWFVGHLNFQKFLPRIVATFSTPSDVVLTGMSAGGSSVVMNVPLLQRTYPSLKVRYINDSSWPPVSKALFPECLQKKLRTLWGLDQSLLATCGASCPTATTTGRTTTCSWPRHSTTAQQASSMRSRTR